MQSVRSGTAITLNFTALDGASNPIKSTSAIWSAVDQDGQNILTDQLIELPEPSETISVVISAETNTLVNLSESCRCVTARMFNAAEHIATVKRHYLVQAQNRLAVPNSSFQSYGNAMLVASKIVGMNPLFGASVEEQESALLTAYRRITSMSFALPRSAEATRLFGSSSIIDPACWHWIDEDIFARLPVHFRRSLCRAQVIEANQLVKGDVVSARRRSGLMAETIGESKMMFRPGMLAPDYGVSAETFRELAGFVHFQNRLGRV